MLHLKLLNWNFYDPNIPWRCSSCLLFLYIYTNFCEHSETVSRFICWSVKHYLQATHCGPPHQNQQKPQPVPGQTCQSAPSDPWGQSGPPEKTRYSRVLQKRKEKTVTIKQWVTVPCVHKVKHSSLSSHQSLSEKKQIKSRRLCYSIPTARAHSLAAVCQHSVLGGLPKNWILLKLCWSCVRKFYSSFWQLNMEVPRPRLSQGLAEERLQRWKQLVLWVHLPPGCAAPVPLSSSVLCSLPVLAWLLLGRPKLCCASRFL